MIGFLIDVDNNQKEVELGYVIHPDYSNKGYATEALEKTLQIIFMSCYQSVKAGAFEENLVSIRVMEKCGMISIEQEDIIEYRGKSIVASITKK